MRGWDTTWIIVTVCGLCGGILTGFSYLWYFLIERAIWTSTLKELIAKNNSSNNLYPDYNQAQYNTPAIVYPQYPSQQIRNGRVASVPPQVVFERQVSEHRVRENPPNETSRTNTELESARPQTVDEEALQLLVALAKSREEAEQEDPRSHQPSINPPNLYIEN